MRMNAPYQYKGFEISRSADARTVFVRRSASQAWTTVIENAPSQGQASKALDDFVAASRKSFQRFRDMFITASGVVTVEEC